MSTFARKPACGFVAINAAFLQEIKEAHGSLWDRVYQMREAAKEGLPLSVDLNQWVIQLSDLRAQLASEFSLEETYGYITQLARPLPGLPCDPSEIRGQHAELYLQLSELCEQIEEAQYRGTLLRDFASFAKAFFTFVDSLEFHEKQESRLIAHGLGLLS